MRRVHFPLSVSATVESGSDITGRRVWINWCGGLIPVERPGASAKQLGLCIADSYPYRVSTTFSCAMKLSAHWFVSDFERSL